MAAIPASSSVVRPRLLAELNDRGGPVRRAVITAPAGFGKSTLLAQHACAFPGGTAWLGLNPAHADPDEFTADLHRAVMPFTAAPDLSESPSRLWNRLRALTGATLLVLDDVHYLDDTAAERVLDRLLCELPDQCSLAVATRRLPGVNLARHELTDLRFIDADQLRFRSWEIDLLLRENYQEPLPAGDIAVLERRLGGWAAGLHLFHLSTKGRPLAERRSAVAALTGRASLAHAYMSRIVLAELPEPLLSFVTRISVFDVATAARCDRLLGIDDAAARLAELHRRQVFVTTTDGGSTFRFHEAMRSHLAAVLADRHGGAAARRLHAAAAEIVKAEGALVEAARSFARAEDWRAVRELLDMLGPQITGDDFDAWRDLLPSWLVADDPWMVLAEGRNRLGRGRIAEAVECFERSQALSADEAGRAHGRQAAAAARVWLPGPARPGGDWRTWLRAATQAHPALIAAAAEDRMAEPHGRTVALLAHVLAGNLPAARTLLRDNAPGDTGPAAVIAPLGGAVLALLESQGDRGLRELSRAVAAAEAERLPWLARVSRAAIALNGTQDAAKAALRVAEECERDGDLWGALLAAGCSWLARLGSGDPDLTALADLADGFRALDAAVPAAWAQAMYAVAAAHAEVPGVETEIERASDLVRRCGVAGAQPLVYVAAAVAAGHPPNLVARARQAAGHCGYPVQLVESWLGEPIPPVRDSTPEALTVTCFGGFRLERDGAEVDLSAVKPKVRMLMRLLAVNAGRPVHREAIIDALWPQATPRAATHGLHVAMSSLRKLIEPDAAGGVFRFLAREGDAYRLVLPADGYCDVVAVREAARLARSAPDDDAAAAILRQASDAYRGDLLPEDGAAEWVVGERERLRLAASSAAADLARLELRRGDVAEALAAAGRSVGVHRFNDEAWRLLIEAHERHGDRAAAADALARYREVLAELGVHPE
ncbi:BTAD domain-containing putative transcriptional regulator [Glycomyces sp. NPDC048151]|uniref:BTAD domain-containing putative transcriptional regulator n=1 Tax=Glycomyces sp. NPDC048151 TaxID=3364002 RepID=UPI0037199680